MRDPVCWLTPVFQLTRACSWDGETVMLPDGGGAAMISSVAPGISGALLTTVLGLLVAIPSGYFYNRLSDAAREIVSDAENFTDELLADIGRIHGRQ